jgi:hypothetical protein
MLKMNVRQCSAWAVLALVLAASNASAQATRTWVSGVGDDANPCSRTAPCKTFAGAISKTAAGGEIDALDPGGFGAVTITKSITIDGGPNAGGILSSGTNAITINAAAGDAVILRNLTIQGAGTGLNGINVLAAGSVHVEKCLICNGTQKGISVTTTNPLRLFVSDTTIRNNTNVVNGGGIFLKPGVGGSVNAILNRVQLDRNTVGLRAEDNTVTSIRDSSLSGNDTHGVVAVSASAVVNLDSCTMSNNSSSGLRSATNATIRCGRSMIVNNSTGLDAVAGGNLLSFTNNSVAGNTVPGAFTGTIPLQ